MLKIEWGASGRVVVGGHAEKEWEHPEELWLTAMLPYIQNLRANWSDQKGRSNNEDENANVQDLSKTASTKKKYEREGAKDSDPISEI